MNEESSQRFRFNSGGFSNFASSERPFLFTLSRLACGSLHLGLIFFLVLTAVPHMTSSVSLTLIICLLLLRLYSVRVKNFYFFFFTAAFLALRIVTGSINTIENINEMIIMI